ncbi:MAG: hypothetical protein ACRDWI_14800 [Jiangellaceae bacterium]
MNVRNLTKFGGQALAVGATFRALRRARAEGDKLRMLDAVVNALAIATTIAILVRELRARRGERDMLDEDLT